MVKKLMTGHSHFLFLVGSNSRTKTETVVSIVDNLRRGLFVRFTFSVVFLLEKALEEAVTMVHYI